MAAFNLSGLRRVALTVTVLVALFSGFFWLGYWTGVGLTLTRQRVATPQPHRNDAPAGEAPAGRGREIEKAMRL